MLVSTPHEEKSLELNSNILAQFKAFWLKHYSAEYLNDYDE